VRRHNGDANILFNPLYDEIKRREAAR
jgi:hypothetical protein